MIPQGGAVEEPKYHVVITVVPRVLDGDILEQTMACTEDVFYPGLHLQPLMEYVPHPAILHRWDMAKKELA